MRSGPSFGDNFKRPRGFGDYPFLLGAAAIALGRRGIFAEKSMFNISSDGVWNGGMHNANVTDSEGARPLLEQSISHGLFIDPFRSHAKNGLVFILRKHVIDVLPLYRSKMVDHKFPHFLIVDNIGNRRWRWCRYGGNWTWGSCDRGGWCRDWRPSCRRCHAGC